LPEDTRTSFLRQQSTSQAARAAIEPKSIDLLDPKAQKHEGVHVVKNK
jgi:hypothetical protein